MLSRDTGHFTGNQQQVFGDDICTYPHLLACCISLRLFKSCSRAQSPSSPEMMLLAMASGSQGAINSW